jgi:tetrahydromethanopterin S-methyltransferase subunit B
MELNMSVYEDAIAVIRQDLNIVFKRGQEFTPVSELRQIESFVNVLEAQLSYFYQLLPRLDSRRGILNLGGTVLKSLFGVAVAADVLQLHTAIDKLRAREGDIVHSLDDQVSYIRNLEWVVRVDTAAVTNLSFIG